ncbi:Hypothetical protein SMAX5B_004086 [Scophthalmus maximus]|uniref:Uncharacterized protein n=1 Tax=Scophthalmus maximus TaxID=52904 RepID=A0A2U9B8K3_SCOMX|nr:Hypothetical protein SMAX5B_004086 [Scophthalmus maximus]
MPLESVHEGFIISSSSEEAFEALLSPVFDGMCFGNASIRTTLRLYVSAAAGGQPDG